MNILKTQNSFILLVMTLFVFFNISAFIEPTSYANTQEYEGIALESETKVYADTSTNSDVLKSYEKGSILKYGSHSNNWYEATVILNNEAHTGYIHKTHVQTAQSDNQNFEGVALKNTTSVYSKASTNSSSLKDYGKGTILKYESYSSNWYKATVYLNHKARTGYIHKNHVETATQDPTNFEGVGTKNRTKVYSYASKDSNALKSYEGGSILKFESFTPNWYRATVILNHEPHTGYISANDVDTLLAEQKDYRGIAINGDTSTYESPNTNSDKVKTYSEGSVLQYTTLSDNWHKAINIVNGNKKTVYIPNNQVKNAVKEQKNVNGIALSQPTKAYTRASKQAGHWKTYDRGSALKVTTFTDNWYEATVIINGDRKNAYFHRDDINTDVLYEKTSYDISFENFVDIQMASSPKADGTGHIDATRDQVEYYSNPANFERGTDAYLQFLDLSQPTGTNASELNNQILQGKGTLSGTGSAFIQGATSYNVNELYLIAHAVHETGNGESTLAQGVEVNGETVYNMYGIHAFDSCPVECGSQKAYEEGWFTPEKAIIGGARFIGQNWIDRGQDTLYKMRWNPNNPGTHQYATHVQWAEIQTNLISDYYQEIDNYVHIYDVPQFVGQPSSSDEPDQPTDDSDESNDHISYPSGVKGTVITEDTGLNLRDAPSGDKIGSIPKGENIKVLGNNGGVWLNVSYDGTEGWVHGRYVEILNLLQIDASVLNVRNQAAGDEVIGQVEDNELVVAKLNSNDQPITKKATYNDTEHTWYNIDFNGESGWISGGFVNIVK